MPSWASISSKPRLTSSSGDAVGDEGVDVDVPVEVAAHERGDVFAALQAAEGGAAHAPAGDQEARARRRASRPCRPPRRPCTGPSPCGRLRRPGASPSRCRSPRRCSRRRSRRSSRGSPATESSPPASRSVAPWPRASSRRSGDRSTQTIRSAPCSRAPATAPRPTMPGAEHHAGRAGLHGGRLDRRAEAGREAAGEQAGAVQGRLRVDPSRGRSRASRCTRRRSRCP